jgi:probable addiction module antidote protein
MPDNTPPLDSLEAIAIHLADAFESGDPDQINAALSSVAMAPAAAELAAAAGITRQQLNDALLSGELPLDMTLAIMKVIDLHLPGGRR